MRSVKSAPKLGIQGTTVLTTLPSATLGNWVKTRMEQATATKPASHASSFRALDGSNAAIMLPAKGRARIKTKGIRGGSWWMNLTLIIRYVAAGFAKASFFLPLLFFNPLVF